LLLGLFFMAVGMSANVGLVIQQPLLVIGLVAALTVVKMLVLYAIGRPAMHDTEAGLSLAVGLSQGGGVGFVLFDIASGPTIIARGVADLLILVVTLSMALTPFLYTLHDRVVRPRFNKREPREYDVPPDDSPPVIIAGFGRVGQVVGRVLRARRVPFTALDS